MTRLLLAGWFALAAPSPDEAARSYDEGDYEAAAAGFRALLGAHGLDRGALHYNLGNAEFRSGRLGHAILHWERALRHRPNDEDALANLALARGASEGLGARLRRVPAGRYALLFAGGALIAGILVTLLQLTRRRRRLLVAGLVLALAAAAVAGGLLAFRVTAPELAVVVRPEAALRSGPGASFPQLAALPEGSFLELGGEPAEGFLRVIAAGIVGYADPASVIPIAENGQNGGDAFRESP